MADLLIPPLEDLEQENEQEEEMASIQHGEITALLTGALVSFVYPKKLGRVLAAQTRFQVGGTPPKREPDLSFVSLEKVPERTDEEAPFAPDLAVEVISKNDDWSQVIARVRQYQAAGVKLIWVVDPYTPAVLVYHPQDAMPTSLGVNDHLDGENILPGFSFRVGDLF
jgi:Uma2 family endonuclease